MAALSLSKKDLPMKLAWHKISDTLQILEPEIYVLFETGFLSHSFAGVGVDAKRPPKDLQAEI